jgi:hypothetical protein
MRPKLTNANEPKIRLTNTVKDKLKRGESVIGPVISVNNVEVAARAAALGFDFIWLEMEHCPLSLETVRNIVLATRGLPAVPLARPPTNELWTAKRLLDAGVLGVIFPFTRNPELARQAVAACRYPPLGLRGSGADQAAFRWAAPEGYYDFADENVLVVTVVEDTSALGSVVLAGFEGRTEPSQIGSSGRENSRGWEKAWEIPGPAGTPGGRDKTLPKARFPILHDLDGYGFHGRRRSAGAWAVQRGQARFKENVPRALKVG